MRRFIRVITIVGLLLLITAIYSPSIDRIMQCDEANTLYKYASNPASALFGYTTPNNHLLHSFFVWITTSLMGLSHIAIRYTALMAGILTLAMAYRVGRKVLNHHSGLASIAILGTSLGMASFSLDARGYTLSAFLTLVFIELIFLYKANENPHHRYFLILVSFLLLLVLPTMVLLLFPILIWKLRTIAQSKSPKVRIQSIKSILSICVGGIGAFFFYIPAIIEGSIFDHLSAFGEPDPITLLVRWLELGYSPPILGVFAFVSIAIGFTFLIVKSHQTKLVVGIVLILSVAITVAIIQFLATGHTLYARNYFYLFPILAVVGGVGLATLLRQWTLPLTILSIMFMILFIPQLHIDPATTQLIEAIPKYQSQAQLAGNHACQIVSAYYEITETQKVDVLSSEDENQSVFIPIPTTLNMSLDRALKDNDLSEDTFGECRLIEDEFDALDVYICTAN